MASALFVRRTRRATRRTDRTSEDRERTRDRKGPLTRENAVRAVRGRVTTASAAAWSAGQPLAAVKSKNRGGSGSLSAARIVFCPAVRAVRLRDLPVGGGQGDQVHAVEFLPDVAPGAVGGVLDHPQEQQGEPAQLDVSSNPILAVVEHRPQPQSALHVQPSRSTCSRLLVGRGQIVLGEGGVGGAQQPLAVQVLLALDRRSVDAQQPADGAAQVAAR